MLMEVLIGMQSVRNRQAQQIRCFRHCCADACLHTDRQTYRQTDGQKGNTPACKGVGAALGRVGVKSGVPVVVVRHKDGAARAVGNIRACLALPRVIPGMKAVRLLLTLTADIVVILLPWLTPPAHQVTGVRSVQ